jgi:hypothetical protein
MMFFNCISVLGFTIAKTQVIHFHKKYDLLTAATVAISVMVSEEAFASDSNSQA